MPVKSSTRERRAGIDAHGMEYPFPKGRCILCLRGEDEVQITKSHLVPEFVGGFLWAYTHCKDCNSFLGHEVESELKRDEGTRRMR